MFFLSEQGQGEYVWDEGWLFTYENWAPNEPVMEGGCILFNATGTWSRKDCGDLHHFICKQTDGKYS